MREEISVVRTSGGDSWEFTAYLPESVEEAIEQFGEDGTLYLINSALLVKQQNIARDAFRQGIEREHVDNAVRLYKPGGKRSVSLKKQVFDKILSMKGLISADAETKERIKEGISKGDWEGVLNILKGLEGEG